MIQNVNKIKYLFFNNTNKYNVYLKWYTRSGREQNNQPTKKMQNDTFNATEYLDNLGYYLLWYMTMTNMTKLGFEY